MKLKFAEILKENLTPRQERYIDVIVKAMKDHFTDESGSVVNNKTIFMENPKMGDYKLKVDLYNEANKKWIYIMKQIKNLLNYIITIVIYIASHQEILETIGKSLCH
jgi:hypothetical protein